MLTNALLEIGGMRERGVRDDDPALTQKIAQLDARRQAAVEHEARELARSRARREPGEIAERQARGELWERLPADLRQEAYAAGEAVLELEVAVEGAQRRLTEHEGRAPKRPGDVEGWATQRGALETTVAAYGRQLEAARAQACEVGQRLAEIAREQLRAMAANAELGVQVAVLEARSLRARADHAEQEAKARRFALERVLAAVDKDGMEALYTEPITAPAAVGKKKGGTSR